MTIRLGISVEGQTEERFVKDLLSPHLEALNIYATPVIVSTSRSASGKKTKGGGINVARVTNELRLLLRGYADGYVTSFYDFYGFEDKGTLTVDELEARISNAVGAPQNFLPYVQLYEFEGLLLSDPATVANYFQAPMLEPLIRGVVAAMGSPERVNDSPNTAPSKRLESWTLQHSTPTHRFSKATKTLHGPQLAAKIGLPKLRAECPRFNEWLCKIEQLVE